MKDLLKKPLLEFLKPYIFEDFVLFLCQANSILKFWFSRDKNMSPKVYHKESQQEFLNETLKESEEIFSRISVEVIGRPLEWISGGLEGIVERISEK